ncbi:aminoglycoside phosphotransferase family protein [Kitasatospora brasiliensis]|uniref:aminoglycoside phosphotransferase family protein n=1 Tax=Kitasatospora brasiliensis TaxID=3058040 RepID=UPI00292CEDB7|nr:aminoglycoside phosphotransferase family protein [Kitasatospora sp. K002]
MCAATRMHPDGPVVDAALVRRLIAAQFPQWERLPITPVAAAGADNAMFRLGPELAVRLPRVEWAAAGLRREQQWLPRLAPRLALPVPTPLAVGRPAGGYPWEWSVLRWLNGANPAVGSLGAPEGLARDLAAFVNALRAADPAGGPTAQRSIPLAARDGATRTAISQLAGSIDTEAATALWDKALRLPAYAGPPVWMHGDLTPGNLLLARTGRLAAVLDFAQLGIGDPTADLIPAWNLLPATARPAFRAALRADDAMWARGRAWAFSIALVTIPYYRHTDQARTADARRVVREVLADRSG